jgi:hypothetical protein
LLQQDILQHHTRKFISRLGEHAQKNDGFVDFTAWITYLTVDIIGDVAFSENLGSLDAGELQPSLRAMFGVLKAFTFIKEILRLPSFFVQAAMKLSPSRAQEAGKGVSDFGNIMRDRRLASTEGKTDFMTYMLNDSAVEGKG